jgi:hypothetical protein
MGRILLCIAAAGAGGLETGVSRQAVPKQEFGNERKDERALFWAAALPR